MSKRGSGNSARAGEVATNARNIENMNEAQLNKEIARTKKKIGSYDKAMSESQKRTHLREWTELSIRPFLSRLLTTKNNPHKTDSPSFKKPKNRFPAQGKLKASFQNQQKQQSQKVATP